MKDISEIVKRKQESLTLKSIWTFAKQETSFDNVFKAACIFASISHPENENIEDYFLQHDFNGFKCNHRMLSSAQLFGLVSKTGSRYSQESVTPVFRELCKYPIGSDEYNTIKTEQLLKIKMSAIIDRNDNENTHHILPVFYIFDVLYALHLRGIESISTEQLFSYVMTCDSYDDLEETVEILSANPLPSEHVDYYIGNSRMWTLIDKNCKLFKISNGRVSINPNYIEFFYNHFYMNTKNVIESILNSIIDYPEAYSKALTTYQNLDIDLTQDTPKAFNRFKEDNQPENKEKITLQYRLFITAIKSKPFVLLAGISGTGKSRIVRELARACWEKGSKEYEDPKPMNFEMVQVKPNWHDSSELIGYVSRIGVDKEGNPRPVFVAGDFLKFVARAWEEPDVPYFLCLDEMNLAPVEQYFAEYLSVIESRKADENGNVSTDPILKKSKEDWYRVLTRELTDDDEIRKRFLEDGICIPQNLIVIGTVNMDETTFSFSRKVLDRAMTIEMNEVDLADNLDSRHERIGKLGAAELIGTAVEGVDIYSSYKEVCDTAIEYLQKVNYKLEGTPFKIAYRTRNEVLLYVVNNLPYNSDEDSDDLKQEYVIARALDEITNMKILSRIEGDETRVSKTFLDDLGKAIKEGLEEIFDGPFDKVESDDAFKSVSLAKLDEMKKRLDSGYTSFWS